MKIAWIVVLYKTPKKEVDRLKKEINVLDIGDLKLYFIDNTSNNKGYAAGVNRGIKKGIREKIDIFIVTNPDVSLKGLKDKDLLAGSAFYDVWGFAMNQNGINYYGGTLDKWRISAILLTKKPSKRFEKRDFVTGSLMIIKKEVIKKVGLLEENYFMYYEDVDYCIRAKRAGFEVGIDSGVVYKHFEVSKENKDKSKYLAKSRIKFFKKYGSLKQKTYEIVRLPKTIIEHFHARMK